MQEYEEYLDDEVESSESLEENPNELLEEDEISTREEAFLKGYDDAADEEENKEEEE
jgi:hypothetical protein